MKSAGKYLRSYVLGIQNAMEYRADFWLSLVSGVFPLMIQMFLWNAIFAGSTSDTVYGYTLDQMILYTIMAIAVGKFVSAGFEYEIANDIKNGGLNKFIVQPISYFWYRVISFYGSKTVQLLSFSAIIILLIIGFSFLRELPISGRTIILFIPSIVMAVILNGMIFYMLSLLAFWMTEVWAVFIGFNLLSNILSGGVFPLDVFGETANRIFSWLPFQYTIYFPINILNGKLSIEEIGVGFMSQAIWVIAITLLANGLWSYGIKKYVAIGG